MLVRLKTPISFEQICFLQKVTSGVVVDTPEGLFLQIKGDVKE